MDRRCIFVENKRSGEQLAAAVAGEGTQLFEGAWYFERTAVDFSHLVITQKTYVCPYKGTCYWIDLETPDYRAENVAFTYFDVKPGYEFIQDKIAFYAGTREATRQDAQLIA